jgi:sigma-70-like protein
MSRLDELPPDQRAALSLILRQRKSYAELAAVLGIPEGAVHDRAHAALAVLAPRQAREVPAERRQEVGDYLLGQQPGVAERLATRAFLGDDEAARAWASTLAGELAPLATDPLPDIPPASAAAAANGDGARGAAPATRETRAPAEPSPAETPTGTAGRASAPLPSSRLGGALLLGAIVAAVVVAVILLSGGGSHGKGAKASSAAASTTSTTAAGPKVAQRLALRSPTPGSSTIAVVEILAEGNKRAYYLAAEHLPPSRGFTYVIWLYNSPTSSKPLSRSPAVASNEKLAGGALLPSDAGNYREMLITRETAEHPTQPGPIVLRGAFSLGG